MILPLFIVPRKKLRQSRAVSDRSIELLEDRNLLAAGIDLLPQNLQAPSSAVVGSGQTIAVEFSIENEGDVDAPDVNWFDNLYLSDDETFGDGDAFLGAVIHTGGVAAGDTYTKNVEFAVPNTTAGDRFLLLVSDDGNGLVEIDEANNVLSRPIKLLPATVNLDLSGSADGPATGLLGASIPVSYTLDNLGPDAMTALFLFTRVWLSEDSELDLGDTILDLRGLPAPLASGESFTDTWDLLLFAGMPGEKFLLFEIDASNAQFEQDENNNVVSVPISLSSVELEAIATAPPVDASIADLLLLKATVANIGSIAPTVSGWVDRVYLSADAILDESDSLISSADIDPLIETIGPGQSYTTDFLLDLSGASVGSQFLIFISDQENKQPELDKQNNTLVLPIEIFSPFDLSITASVSPDTFNVDESVTLNWTVTNDGSATASGNWFDSVYLSADDVFDPTDAILVSASGISIGAGDSYSQSIPSVMTRGAAYLIFVADDGGNLPEFDESNNALAVPINVVSGPDVAVTPTSVPSTIVIGDSLTVAWDITNNGDADVVTPWEDIVYLSINDVVFDGDDILMGRFFHNEVPLIAGLSASASINVVLSNNGGGEGAAIGAVPQGLVPGTYQLIIVSRYFDADRNIFDNVSRTPVTLVVPDVDLAASDGIVPLEITLGDIVNFSVTASNIGSEPTNASIISAAMYYSTDDIFDESDILIGAGLTFSTLGPGDSDVISGSAEFNQGSAGPGYVLLVVNPFADQAETNLDNNVVAIAVDFVQADISVTGTAPSSGVAGLPMSLSFTVTNVGSVTAPAGSFRSDSVYLSTDPLFSFDDVTLFSQATTTKYPLTPGDSYSFSPTVAVPSRPAGSYYILFVADSSQYLPESDETNNVLALPFELFSAQGNLQVVSNTAPTALTVGPLPSFSYTVQNTGTGLSSGTWFDAVYLSSTPTITFSSTLLSLTSQTRSLTPGQSYVNTVSEITIGPRPAGNYFLIFAADEGNGLPESNESDNLVVIPVTIDGPDLQVISIDAPNEVNVGETFNVTYTVQNFGTLATTVNWTDFVVAVGSGKATNPPASAFPLDPGETYSVTVSFAVSINQAPGNYGIRATANLSALQPELLRTNNFLERTITVLDVPLPDLVVTSIVVPPQIVAGREFDLSWTISNIGESTLSTPWLDSVSVVGVSQPFATFLGQYSSSLVLAPGESITRTQRLVAPNFAGELRLVLDTDSGNQVAEGASGETNNRTTSAIVQVLAPPPPPDLVVTNIVPPPNGVFSGQTVSVSFTVTNAGITATNVPFWRDYVFLSSDPNITFDENLAQLDDQLINNQVFRPIPFSNVSYLGSGESYVQTVEVPIPHDFFGPLYAYVFPNGIGFHFPKPTLTEVTRNNNLARSSPFTAVLPPLPDLNTSLIQLPSTVFSGQSVEVIWTQKNDGTADVGIGLWTDSIYLSEDDDLDPAVDTFLGSQVFFGPLAPGQSRDVSLFVTLPEGISASYRLYVVSDSADAKFEGLFEDNNVTGIDLQIELTPPPDLEISINSSPASAPRGSSIFFEYSLTNAGATRVPITRWLQDVYLSTDEVLDDDDYLLNRIEPNLFLEDGESITFRPQILLPATFGGNFFLIAKADANDDVFELDKTNNTDVVPITLTGDLPDLIVSEVAVPVSATSGGTAVVSWSVTNQGLGDSIIDRWTNRIYLSNDTVKSEDDVLLGERSHFGLLLPGQSAAGVLSVSFPFAAFGSFQVLVETNSGNGLVESDFSNNVGAAPITLSSPLADLQITTANISADVLTGQVATISFTVSNQGTRDTFATTWVDDVFLSADDVFDADDLRLLSVTRTTRLAIGQSYTVNKGFLVPETLAAGNYRLFIRTDRPASLGPGDVFSNLEFEGPGEANNQVSLPVSIGLGPTADLVVTTASAPTAAFAGRTIRVDYSVTNQGGRGVFFTSRTDSIYLSLDPVFDRQSDRFVGFVEIDDSLPAAGSQVLSTNVAIPVGLTGQFFVFVVADSGNDVFERGGESNNFFAAPQVMQITLAPPIDLVVGTVNIPANAEVGSNISIDYTVQNLSPSSFAGNWEDVLFLSKDDKFDISDPLLIRVPVTGVVGANGQYSRLVSAKLPPVLPGSYRVILRTDIRNQVFETNDANNFGASLNSAVLDVPSLALDIAQTGVFSQDAPLLFKLNPPTGQTIRLKLDAGNDLSVNELFVAKGRIPTRSSFDQQGGSPLGADQEIVIPRTEDDVYYVLVYPNSTPVGNKSYSLLAEVVPFSLTSVDATLVGNAGLSTVLFRGAGFTRETTFRLVSPTGIVIEQYDAFYVDASRVYVTFDLANDQAALYDARAIQPTGEVSLLADSVNVVEGVSGRLETSLLVPPVTFAGRLGRMDVVFRNTGDADVIAPFFTLKSPTNTPIGLAVDEVTPNRDLYFYGSSDVGPAGIIRAGQTVTVPVYFQASSNVEEPYEFQLFYQDRSDATPIDWDFVESYIGETVRERVDFPNLFSRMQERIGDTWGEFVQMLSNRATQSEGISNTRNWWGLLALEARLALAEIGSSISGRLTSLDPSIDLTGQTLLAIREEDGSIFSTQTLADASYAFETIPAGTYRFRFDEGVLVQNVTAVVQEDTPWPGQTLSISKGVVLTGRTLAAGSNEPIVPTSVVAIDDLGEQFEAQILPDGSYRLANLATGDYRVLIEAVGRARTVAEVTLGSSTTLFDVPMEAESIIQGSVILPGGLGASDGLFVTASLDDAGPLFIFGVVEPGATFELRGLPAGTYTIQIEREGVSAVTISGVAVGVGEAALLPATPMLAGAVIQGKVSAVDPSFQVDGLDILLTGAPGVQFQTQTLIDGSFSLEGLPAGTYQLRVFLTPGTSVSQVRTVTVSASEVVTDADLLVQPGGFIAGTVLDGNGNPLAGVPIRAEQGSLLRTAITNSAGEYRISGLNLGNYILSTEVLAVGSGLAVTVNDLSGGLAGIDFTLPVVSTISGVVRTSSGEPIGAIVYLYQNGLPVAETITGVNGEYVFRVYSAGTVDIRAESDWGSIPEVGGVTVSAGAPVVQDLVTGTGSVTLNLSGSLRARDGAFARIYIQSGNQSLLSGEASIDPQDRIILPNLIAGDYLVAVFGGDSTGAEVFVTLSTGEQRSVSVALAPLERVEGLVTDDLGSPLENAEIQFIQNSTTGFIIQSRTNADGTYAINSLLPGDYTVIIHRQGYAPVVLSSVTVGNTPQLRTTALTGASITVGGDVGLTTPLSPQSEGISGRIVNVSALPIFGARVTAYNAQQQVTGFATTGLDGRFTISSNPGSGFFLIVSAYGFGDAMEDGIDVEAGVINNQGDIVMLPAFGGSFPIGPGGPEPPPPPIPPPPVYPPVGPPVIWEPPKTPPKPQPIVPPPTNPPGTDPPDPYDPPPIPTPDPPPIPPIPPLPPIPPPNIDCPDPCKKLEDEKTKIEELLKRKKEEQFTLKLQLVAQVEKVIAANLREAEIHAIKSTQALEKLFGFKFPGLDQGLDSLKKLLELPRDLSGKGPLEQGQAIFNALRDILKNIADSKKGGGKPSFDKPNIDEFLKELDKLKNDPDAFKDTLKEFAKAEQLTEKLKQKNREVEEIEKRLKKVCDDLANCKNDNNCDDDNPPKPPKNNPVLGGGGGGKPGRPKDPNDIIGPAGFGEERYVPNSAALPYAVRFENVSTATAAAQQVVITQQLDSDLDFRSFRIQEFGFRSFRFNVEGGQPFLSQRLDLRGEIGVYVDAFANIDVQTGELRFSLTAIDSTTGDTPVDPIIGLLPPNDASGIGEGFLTYTVLAKGSAPSGTVVDAEARIIFDSEEPIDTAVWSNTIDAVAPTSQVTALPNQAASAEFSLSWAGGDDASGSGIRGYTIYAAENGGSYFPWLVNTTANEAIFAGTPGTTYSFFSIAIDNAGNVESPPVVADAITRLPTPSPSIRVEASTTAIRNQQVEFSIFVDNAPAFAAGRFVVAVDWNDDGTPDELKLFEGVGSVLRTFVQSGVENIVFRLLAEDGSVLSSTRTSIVIFSSALTASDVMPGAFDLVWGGTAGDDDYRFTEVVPGSILVEVVKESGVFVNTSVLVTGVTGMVRVDSGAGNDNIDASSLVTTKVDIRGDAGDDTIRGGAADDILDGDGAGPTGNDLIFGGGGNDIIHGDGAEGYSSSGLGGKDTIVGGDGNDEIHADGAEGAYNDVLDGGDGDDTLFGDGDRARRPSSASGRDVIIAGAGVDKVHGGIGGDLIVSGATTLAINDITLVAAEWSRSVPRVTRVGNILGPGLPDRANGSAFLVPSVNVVNDDAADEIFSEDGEDWLWLDVATDFSDQTVSDEIMNIG